MQARYQIFVSSTYMDLKKEREGCINELTRCGYITVGMEQFPSTDEEKFEYIKRMIEESDYYIVILKSRYGSVDPKTGVSFTEKEFRYAVEIGRPALAFIFKDRKNLPLREFDEEEARRQKFDAFINSLEGEKIVSYWKTSNELVSRIKDSIFDCIRRRPGIGWVRGDQVLDIRIINELENLRRVNTELKSKIALYSTGITLSQDLKHGSDMFDLKGSFAYITTVTAKDRPEKFVFPISYDDILGGIADALYEKSPQEDISERITYSYYADILTKNGIELTVEYFDDVLDVSINIDSDCMNVLRNQFEALGIIDVSHLSDNSNSKSHRYWTLTEKGRRYVAWLRADKRDGRDLG